MKIKKVFIIVGMLISTLTIYFAFLYFHKYNENMISGTLYIRGRGVTSENVTIYHKGKNSSYSTLPFTEVIKGLGFIINWKDDNTAKIICDGKLFVLNLNDVTLLENGDAKNLNLLEPICGEPGSSFEVLDRELILSTPALDIAIRGMGKNIYFISDYKDSSVFLIERES